jgi:hypothetical protein
MRNKRILHYPRSYGSFNPGCWIFFGIMAFIGLYLTLVMCVGVTDEAGARKTLQQSGYKNISITGYRWFMAGQNEWYSTGFIATSPNGTEVSGAVTRGFLRGNTIRFD